MSTQDHPDTKVTAPNIKERQFTQKLKCDLTEHELATAGQNLAYEIGLKQGTEGELDEIKQTYKAKIKTHDGRIELLTKLIGCRYEMRDVVCHEVRNFADRKMIVVRTDTGAIVEERALLNSELQQPLPGMAEEVPPTTSDADGETETTEAAEEVDGAGEEE